MMYRVRAVVAQAQETKQYVKLSDNLAIPAGSEAIILTDIDQGNTGQDRIGARCRLKGLHVKVLFENGVQTPQMVRMIIFKLQEGSSTKTRPWDTIFMTPLPIDTYIVKYDKVIRLADQGEDTIRVLEYNHRFPGLGQEMIYRGSSGETGVKNQWMMWIGSFNPTSGVIACAFSVNVFFKDG